MQFTIHVTEKRAQNLILKILTAKPTLYKEQDSNRIGSLIQFNE